MILLDKKIYKTSPKISTIKDKISNNSKILSKIIISNSMSKLFQMDLSNKSIPGFILIHLILKNIHFSKPMIVNVIFLNFVIT